jgi:hypothetical protein
MGIDPALAVTLRRGKGAAAELAAIPDSLDLKAADEAIVRAECGNGDDRGRRDQSGPQRTQLTGMIYAYRARRGVPRVPNTSGSWQMPSPAESHLCRPPRMPGSKDGGHIRGRRPR